MSFTMEDFRWELYKDYFGKLSPDAQLEALQSVPLEVLHSLTPKMRRKFLNSLPLEERLAGLSHAKIQQYLDQLTAGPRAASRKPRRKK